MSRGVKYILLAVMLCVSYVAQGQQFPERRHVRKGNSLYGEQRMEEAQKEYRTALQRDSLSVEARFNLGDAQYAMGDFEAAENSFRGLVERNERMTPEQKAKAYFNLGNAQFQQQKLQEALDSYKESLKLHPEDLEAKFNYAYTKAMMQDQQQNQNQNQNQNQQQQQQQQQQQNQNNNEQNNQQQQEQQSPEQQQPEGEQPEEPEGNKPEPSEAGEEREQQAAPRPESEQMLDAVQAAEDKTRDKVDAERAVVVGRSGKNW